MKILFLTTFEQSGGAGLAAHRLYDALKIHTNVELTRLTQFGPDYRKWDIGNISPFMKIGIEKLILQYRLANSGDAFKFESGRFGMNLEHQQHLINSADIRHLHMMTQGFISLKSLGKLAGTKPIVWTLHDMWPFTGGCVYSFQCDRYKNSCGCCPFMKGKEDHDLSNQIWEKKEKILRDKINVTQFIVEFIDRAMGR